MGAELAKQVAARGGHLSGNAFKVLTRMAWTALDAPNDKGQPARLYFGGWEPLAMALGWSWIPDANDPDPDAKRRRRKLQEYVRKAQQELANERAFEKLERRPGTGTRQVYLLTLDRLGTPQKVGGSRPLESGGLSTPESGGLPHPKKSVGSTPRFGVPRNNEVPTEDLPQDLNHQRSSAVTSSRPRVKLERCRHDRPQRVIGSGEDASWVCDQCESEGLPFPAVVA